MKAILAIDVGGTSIKGAVVGVDGVKLRRRIPLNTTTPGDLAERVLASAAHLAEDAAADGFRVEAAGVVVPGLVDEDAGIALSAVNLGWKNVPIRRLLQDRLQADVAFAHDIRAGALAEAVIGAAGKHSTSLFVGIGTGIAAAYTVDGVVVAGATGRGGELGQLCTDRPGERGGPTLEAVASARSIAARYAAAAGDAGQGTRASDVAALAASGDTTAAQVWDAAVGHLAAALEMAIALLDPRVVVIGGGLWYAGDALMEPLRSTLAQRLRWRPPPDVVLAEFRDESSSVGAAVLASRLAGWDLPAMSW